MNLASMNSIPPEKGAEPLTSSEIEEYLPELKMPWEAVEGKKLVNKFQLKNFTDALLFINKIGQIAELEQHHPDLHLTTFKFVTVELSSHEIGGISLNDFILAAKIEELITK